MKQWLRDHWRTLVAVALALGMLVICLTLSVLCLLFALLLPFYWFESVSMYG